MASNADPLTCKKSFMQENKLFSEVELTSESKPVGRLHDIDLSENEIWLLQCPKGMNITELENQKLKIPGRSNMGINEAVSMEFNEGNQQHTFAYYNRKRRYSLRLLPIRGTIVLRSRVKAAETITTERAEECCPPTKRIPLPTSIRVRHPLLGAQYEKKLNLNNSTLKRLRKADEISAQILKQCISEKSAIRKKKVVEQVDTTVPIEINSTENEEDGEDDLQYVSGEKLKKAKNKRKHSTNHEEANAKKIKKSRNITSVSEDLQWLQNI